MQGGNRYDTQKVLKHAKMVEMGALARDPIRESVSLILDAINLCEFQKSSLASCEELRADISPC